MWRDPGLVFPSAVGAFLDAGVQQLIVELADEAGPESIALAAKALAPLMLSSNN